MKFGASTFIWVSPFSSDTMYLFDKAKEQGFDALEICIEDPAHIDAALVAKAAASSGVEPLICGIMGAGRDMSSDDPASRESGIRYMKTCIDLANRMGAPLITGPLYSEVGKFGLQTPEAKRQRNAWAVENMQKMAAYAKDAGVKLAVEPLNRFETDFLNTVDQGLEFLQQVNAENVGFLLDTFHMNIEEKKIGEAIRKAGDKLLSFHACGNDRGAPGSDHIDWDEVKEALQAIGYDAYLVIESFNTDIKEIARAVSLWRPLAASADDLAMDGLRFLKKQFS